MMISAPDPTRPCRRRFIFMLGAMVSMVFPAKAPARTAPAARPSPVDIDVASRTVWGEARGEVWRGKLGISFVIRNRSVIAAAYVERAGKAHALFGNGSLASVCKAPWQFSVWNRNDPNYRRLPRAHTLPGWDECVDAVISAVHAREPDVTAGATHFCAARSRPAWAHNVTPTTQIGSHRFYRLM